MGQLDEVEYARLAAQVLEIEKLVNSGAPGDAGILLRNFLSNAKSRMEEIRQDRNMDGDSKKDRREKETAMAVQLAEMEHRLNAQEKERYAGFMELDYFRKADFEELEEFYSNSWDRLGEGGKNQMSVRVWGGIRRHEYTFEELPQKMREKESERIYLQLTGEIEPGVSLQNVPPEARAEFVREYESGNEKATARILSGGSSAAYSPGTRTDASLKEASVSKETRSDQSMNGLSAKVGVQQENSLDGLALEESGSVPPTGLPISGAKPLTKN